MLLWRACCCCGGCCCARPLLQPAIYVNSSNQCVRICGQLSLGGSRSIVCNSINYVCQKYKVNKYSLSQTGAVRACISAHAETVNSRGDLITAGCIKDLIVLREQHNTAFTANEINELITFLCTSGA